MEGLLEPVYRQATIGKAEVRQIFKTPKGTIAGCMVLSGKITSKSKIKVFRGEEMVHEGNLASLRRFKDDVKEVGTNFEWPSSWKPWRRNWSTEDSSEF
jgi:translation initiation factor IF-2